jgi:CubicO group peptidase (beta-lactamase class C family)
VQKIGWLCLLVLLLSACHAGRFVVYNVPDLRDYRKFAARPIVRRAGEPFRFQQPASPVTLRLPGEISGGHNRSLEAFLQRTGTVAFLVIRHDTLLYEQYFKGYEAASVVPSFSVAKSFVATLVGMAIADGAIGSVQDPIRRYVPELDSARFQHITLEHLLNMRSGLAFRESDYWNPFGDATQLYYGRHLLQYVRRLRVRRPPNQRFTYQSINTELLGLAVARATGRPLAQYLQEKIWQPLGMEFAASWSLDRPGGTEKAFCCLNARARDFAKLGRLYLRHGEWQGQQLVPRRWIELAATDSAERAKNNFRYSYHWRHRVDYRPVTPPETATDKRGVPVPIPDFFAEGILGQFVYVYPGSDFIVVRLGKRAGRTHWARLAQHLAELNGGRQPNASR